MDMNSSNSPKEMVEKLIVQIINNNSVFGISNIETNIEVICGILQIETELDMICEKLRISKDVL